MKFYSEPEIVTVCPACGVAIHEESGEGFVDKGVMYCCSGCATGTGCICRTERKKGTAQIPEYYSVKM
jgi:hypothetical protein